MFEYFTDWAGMAVFYRTVTTKNASGQTVTTTQTVNDGESIDFARWTDKSIQTNQNDKFVLSEVGRLALAYQSFYVTISGVQTDILPDKTWYALIDGKKYFVEGVDNIGWQNELYVFTYRKDRT